MFEKLASGALSLFVTLAVARHLMPEGFGQLSYLLALVALVSPFMTVGLNSVLSREVLHRTFDVHLIIGSALTIRVIAGFLVAPVVIGIAYLYLESRQANLFVFLVLCSVSNAALVVDFWLQAHVASRYSALIRLATLLLFSLAKLVAIESNGGLAAFIYLAGLEVFCLGVFYLFAYNRLAGGINQLRVSLDESRSLLKHSRWLMFSGIAAMIYLKVDQVMLGILVNDRAVGIYAAAARISDVWYFIPGAVAVSYFPQLINKRKNDPVGYSSDLQKLNDSLFCAALVIASFVTLAAPWLVRLLFGASFEESIPVLVVHIWVGIFVFMRALLSKWLITENLLKLSMVSQILGALVNIALNFKLIPLFGPLGAAYATLISFAVASYIVLFFHRDLWPMAKVVSKSIVLPVRLLLYGRHLYRK